MDLKQQYLSLYFVHSHVCFLFNKKNMFYISIESGKLAHLIEHNVCVSMRVSKFTVMSSAVLQPS